MDGFAGGRRGSAWKTGGCVCVCVYLCLINASMCVCVCVCESILACLCMCWSMGLIVTARDGLVMNKLMVCVCV